MKRPEKFGRSGFTLVELLTVMMIIVLITGLSLPALKNTRRAHELIGAGNDLADLAELARQNSLSKNCLTALVLLTDQQTAGTTQALTLLQMLPGSVSTAAQGSRWQQFTNWRALPTGICVDVALPASATRSPDASCTFQDGPTQDFGASTSLPGTFLYRGHSVSTYKFVIFLSNGALLGGNPARVELIEGILPAGANAAAIYTHPLPNTNPVAPADYYRISLLPATGRLKVDRP